MRRIVGGGGDPILVPYEQAYQPGFEDMMRRVPDTRRIRETIGWEPEIDLETTIADVAAHFTNAQRTDPRLTDGE